jgi:hypothetical protein
MTWIAVLNLHVRLVGDLLLLLLHVERNTSEAMPYSSSTTPIIRMNRQSNATTCMSIQSKATSLLACQYCSSFALYSTVLGNCREAGFVDISSWNLCLIIQSLFRLWRCMPEKVMIYQEQSSVPGWRIPDHEEKIGYSYRRTSIWDDCEFRLYCRWRLGDLIRPFRENDTIKFQSLE